MVRKPHRLADPGAGEGQQDTGALPVSRLPEKGRVTCQGRIDSVTFLPADQAAAFSAIVSDAGPGKAQAAPAGGRRGRLRVVWLGRRRVPGIETGAEIRLEGMLSRSAGLPTMFNPRYEILSRQEDE